MVLEHNSPVFREAPYGLPFPSSHAPEAVKVSAEQYVTYIPHPNILDVCFFSNQDRNI